MLQRVGPGSYGYNFQPEFQDIDCILTLANGATCAQGQPVKRDLTATPNSAGADKVLLPTAANAGSATQGQLYGVYQGAGFTNNTGASATYPITVRVFGQGVVQATAGVNLLVGNPVICANTLTATGAAAGAQPSGGSVGIALATGAANTPGATLSTGLINVGINIQ